MTRKAVYVIPNSQGTWDVEKDGHISVRTETKAEAVKIGRIICQRSGYELVKDG
jgi:hypothetical protein